jgi:hypothetical protein
MVTANKKMPVDATATPAVIISISLEETRLSFNPFSSPKSSRIKGMVKVALNGSSKMLMTWLKKLGFFINLILQPFKFYCHFHGYTFQFPRRPSNRIH